MMGPRTTANGRLPPPDQVETVVYYQLYEICHSTPWPLLSDVYEELRSGWQFISPCYGLAVARAWKRMVYHDPPAAP